MIIKLIIWFINSPINSWWFRYSERKTSDDSSGAFSQLAVILSRIQLWVCTLMRLHGSARFILFISKPSHTCTRAHTTQYVAKKMRFFFSTRSVGRGERVKALKGSMPCESLMTHSDSPLSAARLSAMSLTLRKPRISLAPYCCKKKKKWKANKKEQRHKKWNQFSDCASRAVKSN